MATSRNNQVDDLYMISQHLQDLGYDTECPNMESLKTTLTIPSSSRNELLFWTLSMIGLSYTANEQRFFSPSLVNKIVNDLSSIGLCRPQDARSIDGSADQRSQLRFWRTLLEMGYTLKNVRNQTKYGKCDELLHQIVESPHYGDSLKDVDLNLLPKDLLSLYKTSSKKTFDLNQRLSDLRERLENEEEHFTPHDDVDLTELEGKISALSDRSREFIAVYELSMRPWCKGANSAEDENARDMDKAVIVCLEELQRYEKTLKLATDLKSSHERVKEKTAQMKSQECSSAVAVLDSIVNSSY